MTLKEYFDQDIIIRLGKAISEIVNEHGPDPHNVTIFQENEGTGIQMSDVLADAIVEIKRLRKLGNEEVKP